MVCYSSLYALFTSITALVQAVPSSGCNEQFDFPAEPGGPAKGIEIGQRRVWITLPKDYQHSRPAPLVLAFHDKGMTPNEMEMMTGLSDPKVNAQTIVLYPQAVEDRWLSHEDPNVKVDDKNFLLSLLDGMNDRLCIDRERVFATGLGVGGGLAHLMACDSRFSSRVAAFALVNPLLQVGLMDTRGVKDEVSLLWEHCRPERVPVRILEIHGADNSIYGYFGRSKTVKHKQKYPIIQWLVEWAFRNECGIGLGQPGKDSPEDKLYKTRTEHGIIQEGVVYEDKLQRAFYRCWAKEQEGKGNIQKKISELSSRDDNEEKAENLPELVVVGEQQEKGSVVLEHFVVKKYGHGWPRIMWEGNHTVDLGNTSVLPLSQTPTFDATREILRWFDMFKLSDDARSPSPKVKDPLAGVEDFDALIEELSEKIDAASYKDIEAAAQAVSTIRDEL